MAWTNVGTVLVTMTSRNLVPFPTVNLKRNKGFMFYLVANPITTVAEYGYLLIIPSMVWNGLSGERPKLVNWFPKGQRFLFKVTTPEKMGDPIPTTINLFPVQIFTGRVVPKQISATLFYDPGEEEPPGILV